MDRLLEASPMWCLGAILMLFGWGAYTQKRLVYRVWIITGKRAEARGLLLLLFGLLELVTPFLYIGGYIREIDMYYITLIGEPLAFILGFVLLLIFYRPQE